MDQMGRTRIKICGVCRPQDAVLAVSAGADAIGIIRVPSAGRYIETAAARAIISAVPVLVTPVLVYLNASADEIRADLARFDGRAIVQLNGEESPELIRQVGVPTIKAVRMDAHADTTLVALRQAKLPNLVAVTLESPGQMGGSGVGNDWDLVRTLQAEGAFEGLAIIAAGGLTPDNVAGIVRQVRPYAVDVSSGVEERKREKSTEKVARFVRAVREADIP
jgi:phosphoribosylanthranilate isomerase